MSDTPDTSATRTKNTRTSKNDDDPDPASLPIVPTRVAAPFNIPSTTATTSAPSPGVIRREADAAYLQGRKELADLMSGLETGQKYTLQLYRSHPRVWKGKMISGYLTTFPMTPLPTQEDVKQQHGGGTYSWRIMREGGGGPKFGTTTEPFDIAGDPIPPESPAGAEPQHANGGGTQVLEIAKMQIEAAQKVADRAEDRADRALASSNKDGGNSMQMFLNAQEARERVAADARKAELEALRLKIERDERERRQDLEAAEKKRQEERQDAIRIAKEEREEREKRYDKEEKEKERRHQEAMAKMEQDSKQSRLDAEARVKAEQEAAKSRAEMENKNFQLQLQSMKDSTVLQIEAMKSTQAAQMEGYKQLDKMKMDFFQTQLSQKPVDPLDQIEKWSKISEIMSGRDKEEKEPVWKEIVSEIKDAAREAGPSLLAMAGVTGNAIEGATKGGDGQERRRKRKQIESGGRKRPKPGTVVTADLDEEDDLPDADKVETNGLKKLTFPGSDETDINVISDLLMRNIDWALEHDNDATWIVNNVIKGFPPIVGAQLAATPIDVIVEKIEEKIPDTWKLNSPGGIKVVREAHAILKKKK